MAFSLYQPLVKTGSHPWPPKPEASQAGLDLKPEHPPSGPWTPPPSLSTEDTRSLTQNPSSFQSHQAAVAAMSSH